MSGIKIIDSNKKAYHDYFIEDTQEAGIVLAGSEVKSVRAGQVNIRDSFCIVKNGELWLVNAHIKPYDKGSFFNEEARRMRKLLMKKREIEKIQAKTEQKGYTVVPTKIYLKGGLVKVEVGLAKGKELHDKRTSLADKQSRRDLERAVKQYNAKL